MDIELETEKKRPAITTHLNRDLVNQVLLSPNPNDEAREIVSPASQIIVDDGGDQYSPPSDRGGGMAAHSSDVAAASSHVDDQGWTRHKSEALLSPERKKYLRYQSPSGKGSMRHQLLVQRTFSPHEADKLEPRTSSPMRKVRVYPDAQPISHTPARTPSSRTTDTEQHRQINGQFISPINDKGYLPSHEAHPIFKTPIRSHHPSGGDARDFTTPSRPVLSLLSSPASSGSCVLTPGRHFVNPFEMDHDRLNLPVFSPSVFKVSTPNSAVENETERFWSVEHRALLMPVDIRDSEVKRQFRHQRRLDREKDGHIQSAINAFFSNHELIVPSPWSEKVNHHLPRTPGAINSVSCQTALSVPPDVDLLAELGDKYLLTTVGADPSPSNDSSMGNSFIRRKLLNQLNENDSEILASPALPFSIKEKSSSSVSPSPAKRQSTPEWEHQTPNKRSSGHFSSSPIREEPDERGHYPALSESDLLASPELSPIAGSRSVQSPVMYFSEQDVEHPRAIMQLDFSSILDEGSGNEEDEEVDKLGTLIQQTGTDTQPLSMSMSQDADRGGLTQATLSGGESVVDGTVSCSVSEPKLGFTSQDTGYQTIASSLQSTTSLALSASNLPSLEAIVGPSRACSNSNIPSSLETESGLSGASNTVEVCTGDSGSSFKPALVSSVSHCDLTSEFTRLKSRPDLSFDGSSMGSTNNEAEFVIRSRKRDTSCLVRKIRALSDVRVSREKKRVSRDLTQSFNANSSVRCDAELLRRSVSDAGTGVLFQGGAGDGWDRKSSETCSAWAVGDVSMRSLDSSLTGKTMSVVRETNVPSKDLHMETNELSKDLHMEAVKSFAPSMGVRQEVDRFLPNYESMQTASVCANTHKDGHKNPESFKQNLAPLHDEGLEKPVGDNFQSRFSLGDDHMLEHARKLLGQSEKLRQRHSELDLEHMAYEETFHHTLLGGRVSDENMDPLVGVNNLLTVSPGLASAECDVVEAGSLMSTPRILESLERNINNVQSAKLGSEIAAEILKRAGDDLAKVNDSL